MFSFFDDLISILFIGFVVGNTELDSNPKIAKLNSHISPSEGILKSFEEDKQTGF